MSLLATPSPRTVTTTYLSGEVVQPGYANRRYIIHRVTGSRLGIAVRFEGNTQANVYVQPYSSPPAAYGVGEHLELFTVDGSLGTATYEPETSHVLIGVYITGSSPETIRALQVTDFPSGAAPDDTQQILTRGVVEQVRDATEDVRDRLSEDLTVHGRVHEVVYDRLNPALGSPSSGDYQIRDDDNHLYQLVTLENGAVDNSISVYSGLDVPVRLKLLLEMLSIGSAAGSRQRRNVMYFFEGDDPIEIPPSGRCVFVPTAPERFQGAATNGRITYGVSTVVAMPLLREPVRMQLSIQAVTPPTAGEVAITHVYRT